MDFDSLITVAATNSNQAKAESQVKRYTTDVKPAKKPPKSTVQSEAVKAFLRKKEVEEQKRKVEAMKERDRLLELRSAAKHNRRASNMARRTKDNDFGINFERLQQEKEEKELADAVAAAVGVNTEEVSVEKRRRRRKKLLSDERLEHDLGADRILTLRMEDDDVRNGTPYSSNHRRNEPSGQKFGRDSTSVPHRPVNNYSTTPTPSRGTKRPAPPPPDFFSLLKIAKTKQFEPIEIAVKKKVESDDDRPMTKEEKEKHRNEKAYLAAKEARSIQKQAASRQETTRSENSHRPASAGGGASFKIPKTKPVSKSEPSTPPPPHSRNSSSKGEQRPHSSSKKTPPIQNNIANQLNAKVTKFPSSFNHNSKVPSDSSKRNSHQPTQHDRRSMSNGVSHADTSKPTKSSSGPTDAGRHSSNKDYAHAKGPPTSKPSNNISKVDSSERLQSSKVPPKPAPSKPLASSSDSASGKTARNPFSTPARSKNAVRVAPISNPRSELPSRPPSGGRTDSTSRLSEQRGTTDKLVRPPTTRPDSAGRKDVPPKSKTPSKQTASPAPSERREASSKSQPRPEIRKAPQVQDARRPSSTPEARKAPVPEVRKSVPGQDARKLPPNQKVPSGQEVRRVPPGQEVRRAPPGQEVRRPPPNQEVRRPPPNQEVRRPPPNQEVRRPPPNQEVRRPPPNQDVRRPPPNQEVRRPPPNQEVRRPPPSQEVRRVPPTKEVRRLPPGQDVRRAPPQPERRLPPSQEIRRLPSGQVVRRALPPESSRPYPPSRLPPITRNPGSFKRRIESSDEDEEMDDFIDDGPVVGESEDVSRYIREIFGYDKRRFIDEPDDDAEAMETSFAQQMKEEARSTRLGLLEDLEDIRKEQELKAKKKQKKL